MITGWRLSPSHNLLHTRGPPHLITGESLYIERPVSMLSQPVAHPFYRVLSHRQEDGSSNEFCGFLRYMKQTPNFALSFYSCIRLGFITINFT